MGEGRCLRRYRGQPRSKHCRRAAQESVAVAVPLGCLLCCLLDCGELRLLGGGRRLLGRLDDSARHDHVLGAHWGVGRLLQKGWHREEGGRDQSGPGDDGPTIRAACAACTCAAAAAMHEPSARPTFFGT